MSGVHVCMPVNGAARWRAVQLYDSILVHARRFMELLRACSVRRSVRGSTELLHAGATEPLCGGAPGCSVVAFRAAPWSLRGRSAIAPWLLRGRSVVAP